MCSCLNKVLENVSKFSGKQLRHVFFVDFHQSLNQLIVLCICWKKRWGKQKRGMSRSYSPDILSFLSLLFTFFPSFANDVTYVTLFSHKGLKLIDSNLWSITSFHLVIKADIFYANLFFTHIHLFNIQRSYRLEECEFEYWLFLTASENINNFPELRLVKWIYP